MSVEGLISKYINSAEKVLGELQLNQDSLTLDKTSIDKVLGYVESYLADAKYYKAQKRFETSLTSVAYCEGLLDALRLLGAVRFEWPEKPVNEK